MTANEARVKLRDKYKTILGRNRYSQAKRSYVFAKYSDGKYYSDCSSSVAATYRECGYPIVYNGSNLPNTVGIYHCKALTDVPVVIEKGVIQNPEVLRVGDMLLFAGSDKSRAKAGYVGHVEMVGEISAAGKVTIYGHGRDTPRATEMNAYCRQRYAKKTGTKVGNMGLIRVRRRIQDDPLPADVASEPSIQPVLHPRAVIYGCKSAHLRTGPGTEYASVGVCKKGDVFEIPDTDEWVPVICGGTVRWISARYVLRETSMEAKG